MHEASRRGRPAVPGVRCLASRVSVSRITVNSALVNRGKVEEVVRPKKDAGPFSSEESPAATFDLAFAARRAASWRHASRAVGVGARLGGATTAS